MTNEAAPHLAEHTEHDTYESVHGMPRPSNSEAGSQRMRSQATLDRVSTDTQIPVESNGEPIKRITIDLRAAADDNNDDVIVELDLVRDSSSMLVLDPLATRRTDIGAALVGNRQSEFGRIPERDADMPLDGTPPPSALLLTGLANPSATQAATKRIMDITIAALALLILLPLIVFVAILIKVTSRGPVLYRSTRTGRAGKEFTFLKFRSMYDGAAEERSHLEIHNEQSGPVFKMRADPRVTPLGRFLRKTSIDELPQLVHVLSGKMSLVGPRPALPKEVAQYDHRASQRLVVKPGITCIWQVSGRSELDFDTWIDMDLEYIKSWTLFQDLRLLVRTVPAILSGRGAY